MSTKKKIKKTKSNREESTAAAMKIMKEYRRLSEKYNWTGIVYVVPSLEREPGAEGLRVMGGMGGERETLKNLGIKVLKGITNALEDPLRQSLKDMQS